MNALPNNKNLDSKKISELFSLVNKMDSQELKQYSVIHKIPLSVMLDDGNNLIHMILLSEDKTKNEVLRLNLIKFLVLEGCNPDTPNKDNVTALHISCQKQYSKIIEYLLSIGANPNYEDNIGQTPLHYLLGGNIELCNFDKTILRDFIQPPKSVDPDRDTKLLDIKRALWTQIKKNDAIKTIENTIEGSIYTNDNVAKNILQLQNRLKSVLTSTKSLDREKSIKEVVAPLKSELSSLVLNEWNKFIDISDIELHEKKLTSYPQNHPTLSIIKEHDYKLYLKNKLDESIKSAKNTLETKSYTPKINNFSINGTYLTILNKLNITNEHELGFDKTTITDEFIHPNATDNAGDIIDWDKLTFAGGSRNITIIHPVVDVARLFNRPLRNQLTAILYSLVKEFNVDDAAVDDATVDGAPVAPVLDEWKKKLVEYLVLTIENQDSITDRMLVLEEELLHLEAEQFSNHFEELLKIKRERNIPLASWVYAVMTRYVCFINPENSNLVGSLREPCILLVAALGNYTTDLELSIKQAFRFKEIILLVEENHKNLGSWVKKLLSGYNEENDKLETIKTLTEKYFNDENYDGIDNTEWIPDFNSEISKGEKLVSAIMHYYNLMPQKPLLQNVVDTISVIRYKSLYKDKDYYDYFIRIKPDNNDELNLPNINNSLKKLFGENDNTKKLELISRYELPSRIGKHIYHNEGIDGIVGNKQTNKEKEARYLGLFYMGHLPNLEFRNQINSRFKESIKNNRDRRSLQDKLYEFEDGTHVTLYINLGNTINMLGIDVTQTILFNINGKVNSPPLQENYDWLMNNNIQKIYELFNIIVNNRFNLKNIIDSVKRGGKNFAKILPYYIPILNSIESHIKFIGKNIKDFKHENVISQFIDEINNINSYFYLYYYMHQDGKKVKIPKFFYYTIPNVKETSSFLSFDNEEESLVYPNGNIYPVDGTDDTNDEIISKLRGSYNFNENSCYNCVANPIRNRNYFLTTKEINSSLIRTKRKLLPPALKKHLPEFYEINVKEIIKSINNVLSLNLTSTLGLNIDAPNRQIQEQFIASKIAEKLIQGYFKNYVNQFIYKLYTKFVSSVELGAEISTNLVVKPSDFELKLDSIEIDMDELMKKEDSDKRRKELLNFYQFSQKLEKNNKFVIYPNDYTNTNMLRNFYCLDVNNDGIRSMIGNRALVDIKDIENQTPLYSLLKNYYAKPFETMKDFGIDYRLINTNNKSTPISFMLEEYRNHTQKITGGNNSSLDRMKFFIKSQYEQIKEMILADEKYGNNLMKNLDSSFLMASYLTQEYLTENLLRFSDNFGSKELHNLEEFDSDIETLTTNYYNRIGLPKNDKILIAKELHTNFTERLKELTKKQSKYEKEKTEILRVGLDGTRNKEKLDNIKERIGIIRTKLDLLNNISTELWTDNIRSETNKIIPNYNSILKSMTMNHGVYMLGWNKLLGNESKLILMKLINHSDDLKKLKKSYHVYQHWAEIGERYYRNPRYTTMNKPLGFVKDVLVHLTQNVLCYGIEMITRKVLYQHLHNTYPNDSILEVIQKIDYMLKFNYKNKEILTILYDTIAEKLVMNSVNVFKDQNEERAFDSQSIKELLTNFFELLTISDPIKLEKDSYAMRVLKQQVSSYFDTFISKTINNWAVVIENHFRFNINQKRIIECILTLTGQL